MAGPNSIDPKVFDPANLFDPDYQMTSDDILTLQAEEETPSTGADNFIQTDLSAELAQIFGSALDIGRAKANLASAPLVGDHKPEAPQLRTVIDLDDVPDPKSNPDTYSIVELDPRDADQKQTNKV